MEPNFSTLETKPDYSSQKFNAFAMIQVGCITWESVSRIKHLVPVVNATGMQITLD